MLLRRIVVIQCLVKIRFYEGLPADMQFACDFIKFFQHKDSEIDINSLTGYFILPVLVKYREISSPLSAICAISSALSLFFLDGLFIKLSLLGGLISKVSQDEYIHPCYHL